MGRNNINETSLKRLAYGTYQIVTLDLLHSLSLLYYCTTIFLFIINTLSRDKAMDARHGKS